jgi:hypothetical protein
MTSAMKVVPGLEKHIEMESNKAFNALTISYILRHARLGIEFLSVGCLSS